MDFWAVRLGFGPFLLRPFLFGKLRGGDASEQIGASLGLAEVFVRMEKAKLAQLVPEVQKAPFRGRFSRFFRGFSKIFEDFRRFSSIFEGFRGVRGVFRGRSEGARSQGANDAKLTVRRGFLELMDTMPQAGPWPDSGPFRWFRAPFNKYVLEITIKNTSYYRNIYNILYCV